MAGGDTAEGKGLGGSLGWGYRSEGEGFLTMKIHI
jgi:hypothetical protein